MKAGFYIVPARWICVFMLCAAVHLSPAQNEVEISELPVLEAASTTRSAPLQPVEGWVAIMQRNISLDGYTFLRGTQYPVEGVDAAERYAFLVAKDQRFRMRLDYLMVLPFEEAGVTIVKAEYGIPGQVPQNISRYLEELLSSAPDAQILVNDSLLDTRRAGGGSKRAITETVRYRPAPGYVVAKEVTVFEPGVRVLDITYAFEGKSYRRIFSEGQFLQLP